MISLKPYTQADHDRLLFSIKKTGYLDQIQEAKDYVELKTKALDFLDLNSRRYDRSNGQDEKAYSIMKAFAPVVDEMMIIEDTCKE